jgi:hypothetical protein
MDNIMTSTSCESVSRSRLHLLHKTYIQESDMNSWIEIATTAFGSGRTGPSTRVGNCNSIE